MIFQFIGTGNMSSKSFNACAIIDDKILVDAPPGVCKQLNNRNIDINNIDAIIITHQHIDHYFDLPVIIHNLSQYKGKCLNIFANKNIVNEFINLMKLAFPDVYKEKIDSININFVILEENNKYNFNDINFKIIPVKHGNLDSCFGIIFNKNDMYLGYSGDACLDYEIENMCDNCNHVIMDCTHNIGNSDHMGLDNIYYLCNKYMDTVFYVTHLSNKINKNEIKKLSNLVIPNDGDVYKV